MGWACCLGQFHEVLRNPKKLIAAVADMVHGGDDNESLWTFNDNGVTANMGGSIFSQWQNWRHKNILPRLGGWQDQPLFVLSQMAAIDLVYGTLEYTSTKDADWGKLSPTQIDIKRKVDTWL